MQTITLFIAGVMCGLLMFLLFHLVDFFFQKFVSIYRERTNELKRSNEIREKHFEIKMTPKPIKPPPQEFRVPGQTLADVSKQSQIKEPRGTLAYFPEVKP